MGSRKLKNAVQSLIQSGYLQRLVEDMVKKQLALAVRKNDVPLVPPVPVEKKSPPLRRKSPRNKEVAVAPKALHVELVEPEIMSDDSDVVFYGINGKVEAVGGEYLLISTKDQGVVRLHEVRGGVTVSSITLISSPTYVALVKDAIVIACKVWKGFDVYYLTLPLGESLPTAFPSIQAITPSLKIACTGDATYCSDKNEGLYDLMSLRTRWPAGRALIDNESSLFVVSVTRLRRILKSKESGIPTWEHILLTEATNHLHCNNEHIVYAYGAKIVSVRMSGDTSEHTFPRAIRSIALGTSICYVVTEDGILHTLDSDSLKILSGTALEEYVPSTTLTLSGTTLYYNTGYSVRRFTLH